MGPLFHVCSRVRSGLGPSRAEVGLALALQVVSGASVRPRLLWSVFGPSSVRFFFSLALSRFARSGLGVLVLVFFLFPVLFCVPRLVFRLGSLSFHGHFHLIFMFISSTLLRQGVCVCIS